MGDEREWKAGIFHKEEDYTEEVNEKIKVAQDFLASGKLQDALDCLLQMEKTTRLGGDTKSTMKVAREIVRILVDSKDFEKLLEHVQLLMKRRAQMKQVQTVVVQESYKAVELSPTQEVRVDVIQKLRSICEGKLHVELEYARLTVQLAQIWDKEGKLKEACAMLQQLQVETIGNMERKEKLDVILLQIDMCLRTQDYVVANVMAKKIPQKSIDKPDLMGHKIRFYQYLIQYYTHYENHFMLCKCYSEIYTTIYDPAFKPEEVGMAYDTPEKKLEVLQNLIIYLLLSPSNASHDWLMDESGIAGGNFSNPASSSGAAGESKDQEKKATCVTCVQAVKQDIHSNQKLLLLRKHDQDKRLLELPLLREVVRQFISSELISWAEFAKQCASLQTHPVLAAKADRWQVLRRRVTEHNIRVISTYYSRLTLARFAQLVDQTVNEAEDFLCEMISNKLVYARINRPDGLVDFSRQLDTAQRMNEWTDGVNKVLSLFGTTCHQITKELMVHKARLETTVVA